MRYLAALCSLILHVLFVLFFFSSAVSVPDESFSVLGLDLISVINDQGNHLPASSSGSFPLNPDINRSPEKKQKSKAGHLPRQRVESKPDVKVDKSAVRAHVAEDERVDRFSPEVQRVQKPEPLKSESPIAQGMLERDSGNPDAVVLRQGKGVTIGNNTVVLKRGSESRSMDSIAGYGFDESDFRGHYETSTGRQVVVIDDRAEHGRLVLHDRKTGLIRRLKKAGYGDFIYTYGPSFDEDEPVEGSVVFLPGDEHWIHRFMWLPGEGAAEYPVKGRLDALNDESVGKENNLFVPVRKGRYPAVILAACGEEIPAARFSEIARHLCGRGVVVEVVNNPDSANLKRAAERLMKISKVDEGRIGLWLRCYKVEKIPRIPRYAGRLGFVILTIDSPADGLYPESVASAVPDGLPAFLGFRNVGVDWKSVISVLQTGFQSPPHQLTVVEGSPKNLNGAGEEVNWVDSVSGDFVSSISAWLDSQLGQTH